MNLQNSDEPIRQLTELAVNAGRSFQSSQTGFVHHYYHAENDQDAHAIPLLENFLFALALLRTKTAENMTEAKTMIDRLLWFQSPCEESKGNFPIYLHDYPLCRDWWLGIHLLPVFFRIL